MCNISTIMYHVIHDDHLEIKLIVLYCITLQIVKCNRLMILSSMPVAWAMAVPGA